jgi:transcriptional regulator with XRE-family HTH domain
MDQAHAKRLGVLIRQYRAAAGLSLRQLEDLTDIDDSRIAEALGVPLADMYAIAGYDSPGELPTLKPYLRTKYRRLPAEAADQLEAYAERLAKKHGVDLSGPAPGEDESPEPTARTRKKGGTFHVSTSQTKR